MRRLRQLCDVRFYKIKAHSNIPGNERAGRLAKQATSESAPMPLNPVDYDAAKVLIRRAAVKDWQSTWNGSNARLRSIVPREKAP